jgi:putative MFS transporter
MNQIFKGKGMLILVASLGYFVDIYDLQLFNIISTASLKGIGITDEALLKKYDVSLFNWQMVGMLIGGLLWGIWGDKKGRKSVLFGSILLYSLANIANAFVTNITQYEWIRLLAGIGLAGELGAGITMVSESFDKEKRGIGTMVIATMGALGAVVAALVSRNHFDIFGLHPWQEAYLIGGILGLSLLFLRVGTFDSEMFHQVKEKDDVKKGSFFLIFKTKERTLRYLACVLIGLPVWFVVGILIKFSSLDFHSLLRPGEVAHPNEIRGIAVIFCYIGLSVGDLVSGLMSQWMRSRRKVIFIYLISCAVLSFIFLELQGISLVAFQWLSFSLGFVTGYWALFVSLASEQFGTNIRATVTTTAPNFVRGGVLPITMSFVALSHVWTSYHAAYMVGAVCFVLAIAGTWYLKETFGKDLNFVEE